MKKALLSSPYLPNLKVTALPLSAIIKFSKIIDYVFGGDDIWPMPHAYALIPEAFIQDY